MTYGIADEGRISHEATAFARRIAAWAEAPWCRTRTMSPTSCWDEPNWSSSGAIAYKLDQYRADRTRGWPHPGREGTDRIYRARVSGKERIVITEPDGSSRLLCGVDTGHEPFSLVYGGSGEAVLARRLTADALGPLALCPACHGGSAADWMPGWCRTCRGLRKHPGLGRAEQAVATEVVKAANGSIEWNISRSDLLNAVATLDSRGTMANPEPNRTER